MTLLVVLVWLIKIERVLLEYSPYSDYYQYKLPWIAIEHAPDVASTTISPYINGSEDRVPLDYQTPDYRLPEPPWIPRGETTGRTRYGEQNRPYRLSPWYNQWLKFSRYYHPHWENWYKVNCFCTTVFKRLTLLAGCAVITTRHALTTATSTEIVLKRYKKKNTLENILGLWYDVNINTKNSSMYITPARIHYHPLYSRPQYVNRSHPLPCAHDLAVWATTFRYMCSGGHATYCNRGTHHRWQTWPSAPREDEQLLIVGFQFVWSINRKPMPWFKYLVRTKIPKGQDSFCPKTEWGWFHCVPGSRWSKYGLDSGAGLQIAFQSNDWRWDGMIGMNTFSMELRSRRMLHYFNVIDTHINIDFFYASYMGTLPYEYLDFRFFNTQWKAPIVKPWYYIPWTYDYGKSYDQWEPPYYK